MRVERARRELALRYDWSARAAFETVDSLRDYALNHRNIQSFLRLNGFIATDGEVIAIIRRLDSDGNNTINFDEFAEGTRTSVPTAPTALPTSSFEESKRPSSPLRRTAASPLRQTETAGLAGLTASATNLGAGLSASQGSPARTTSYAASLSSPSRRFSSPMKPSDENELVRAFREQIALENELEEAKNRLALQPDFNVPDAFDLLDRHRLN